MFRVLKQCLDDSSGVTAIKDGLIAALTSNACVVVWGQVGTSLSSTFNTIAGDLSVAPI
jgi:Flp pilus assembly pilin Flp